MWIKSVDISGFRAFSGSHRFDLDGDIVLVIGVNGQGKTSLFDAILWAVTGEISRLDRPDSVVSLYSSSGEARVTVTLRSEDGRTLEVTRHSDGERIGLLVGVEGETFRGRDANTNCSEFFGLMGWQRASHRQHCGQLSKGGCIYNKMSLRDFLRPTRIRIDLGRSAN